MKIKRFTNIVFALVVCVSLLPVFTISEVNGENPGPFFSISVLSLSGSNERNQIATLLVEQLPKLGIQVNVFEIADLEDIAERSWDYSGPFPIPTFAEGGFDLVLLDRQAEFDYNPTELFDSTSITPFGENFYQFELDFMDISIDAYTSSTTNITTRTEYANDIQAILYEYLPQTTLVYPSTLFAMNSNFDQSFWDGILWAEEYQTMENWEIHGQNEFHYASYDAFEDFYIHNFNSRSDGQWLHQIYGGLLERQTNTHLLGNYLASSFNINGPIFVIDMNPNAKWADGTPVTAFDVEYSFNLLMEPLNDVSNSDFYQTYFTDYFNVLDTYSFEVVLSQPYAFPEQLFTFDILPKHIWETIAPENHTEQAYDWAINDPNKLMGVGPYYLDEYDNITKSIHLVPNTYYDDFSGAYPKFHDIYFHYYSNKIGTLDHLERGIIDFIDNQFDLQIDEIPKNATSKAIATSSSEEIAFNMKHHYIGSGSLCPIADPASAMHLRKAISHMLPRDVIANHIYDGMAAPGITAWNPISNYFDESLEVPEYTYEIASDHMYAAGFYYPFPSTTTVLSGIASSVIISTIILFFGIVNLKIKKRRKGR